MTEITVTRSNTADCRILGFQCEGHAETAESEMHGVVCASVSLCMDIVEIALREVLPSETTPIVSVEEDRHGALKNISWAGDRNSSGVQAIAESVAEVFKRLAAQYPEYVAVENKFI